MRIALVTDAWAPQVNGVVRTWERVIAEVQARGHSVDVISPDGFRTIPCPTYPEIRLAVRPRAGIERRFDAFAPDAIHIGTEGPLGFAARAICLKRSWPFTTSYHTKFPEYLSARAPIPLAWGYALVRWFHRPSRAVLVATATLRRELEAHGFERLHDWTRGVDLGLFRPDRKPALDLPKPVLLCVGRVAVEKNLEAFLDLEVAGTKLVVGDGPDLKKLQKRYPDVVFAGAKVGEELAAHYTAGDVFVFPSLTDTFGLVLIEALAAGVPVAAFPVTGPIDVVGDADCAVLDADLAAATRRALTIPRERCPAFAARYSWARTAEAWLAALAPIALPAELNAAD